MEEKALKLFSWEVTLEDIRIDGKGFLGSHHDMGVGHWRCQKGHPQLIITLFTAVSFLFSSWLEGPLRPGMRERGRERHRVQEYC